MKMKKKLLSVILCFVMILSCTGTGFAKELSSGEIKNIIYMIPDGGGMVPFYLSDALKQDGGWDRNVFPNSTVTEKEEMYAKKYLAGAITTHSANADVTDSAAAGTALSSGYKTKNGYVGINPDKIPHANILESAQYAGKNVGMVSTYEWTNATPASFSAHEKDRGNYPPMSQQIVNQGIDVVLGGGFGAAKWGDISEAEIRGYNIINNYDDLNAVRSGDKIWGNLVSGAFPYDIERNEKTPSLAEMTKTAITALDDENENGFFLMVEGSKVDGGGHSNYAIGMVSEFLAFDEACKVALKYAEGRNDTIVIIAPDHDTGGMILSENIENTIGDLKQGIEPADVSWEGTGHTARNGGLFICLPKGQAYPEGISGKNIGTEKAYEENVVDNTIIAPYLAEIMGVNLDDISKKLFVDVTDMGTYDSELELFIFNDYPVSVQANVSYAYVNNEIADLDGQVTLYINGRFYVPQILLDIAQEKADYKVCSYARWLESSMDTYMPDTTDITKWNGRIKVKNFLSDKKLTGKIRFTYPEEFTKTEDISISVDGASSKVYEFECPKFDAGGIGVKFGYDIITDDGSCYSFESAFKGLAYAGFADGEVVIDGIIDDEAWKNGVVMTCDDASKLVMIEDWKGERDLSADFSILWDNEYFYLYAVVTDEIFSTDELTSKLWRGDSVQFGIYHDTEGALVSGTAGADFEEIGIAFIDNKPVAYRFKSRKGDTVVGDIECDGFEMACVKNGDDLTYELKFKWSDLFGYEFVPEKGSVLGFSALINDNDGGGRRGWMEYGSGIGMSKNANQFVMMPFLDNIDNSNEIKIIVNGKKVKTDVSPIMIEDRTMLTASAMFDALGAEFEWNEETKILNSKRGDVTVTMQIGNNNINVSGAITETDVPAQIVNGRVMVPVRAVSEGYSHNVRWEPDSKTVIITE